jgi:hypothetical protein
MSLPNMSNAVNRFAQSVTLKTGTQTIVDHVVTPTYASSTIQATIQTADTDKLNIDVTDYDKKYITIHSTSFMKINDKITYKTEDYLIIRMRNNADYGFFKAVAEEIKK